MSYRNRVSTPALSVGLIAFAVCTANPPAAAQGPGTLTRVTTWEVDDTTAFEAGLKAHNTFHGNHGDPAPIQTFEIVSGDEAGKYLRVNIGIAWADFDIDPEVAAADAAHTAEHVDPHIVASRTAVHRVLPEVSKFPGAVGGIAQFHVFDVKIGQGQAFEQAIAKFHAALSMVEDWPPYIWYVLVDGGTSPTFTLVLPRETWAEFEPRDPGFPAVIAAEYGEETAAIFESFFATFHSHDIYTAVHRPDLSYQPAEK